MTEPIKLPPDAPSPVSPFESEVALKEEVGASGATTAEPDEPVIFARLESGVWATAISPDGRWVIVGLGDGTLQLFDLIGGVVLGQPFEGHQDRVFSVAFSPDGKTIVSSSHDGTLLLWSLEGNPRGKPLEGHRGVVLSVAFSPDGQTIVSGSEDTTLRLWNLEGNPRGNPLEGHRGVVWSVAVSPDGKRIVSGSQDGTLWLWNLEGNPVGKPFEGHHSVVCSVAFSPDGQTIVSSGRDGSIRLWNLDGVLQQQILRGYQGFSFSVAFLPDGKTVIGGISDGTICLWNLEGTPLGNPAQGHSSAVRSLSCSPDGKTIVSGSDDGTLRLWNLDRNRMEQFLRRHQGPIRTVAFAPDGQAIVSGSDDKTLRLWDLKGNALGEPFQEHEGAVLSLAVSPDGQTIVSGSEDTTIRLWDLKGNSLGQSPPEHHGFVVSVAFLPDGDTVFRGYQDGAIQLWTQKGGLGSPFAGQLLSLKVMALAPDGQRVATANSENLIQFWNWDGTLTWEAFQRNRSPVLSLAFSPDGQTLVSGSGDGILHYWNLEGNPEIPPLRLEIPAHPLAINAVAVSPDSTIVATGSADKTIRFWSLDGSPLGEPLPHDSAVLTIAFSPDGQTIVSGSADASLVLWQLDENFVGKRLWGEIPVLLTPIRNLAGRSKQILVPQNIANDAAQGEDQLSIGDEIEALATVLMLRSLQPPVAVGILGNWGSGKSFGMHLIQQRINKIRSQKLDQLQAWGDPAFPTRTQIMSPYVGHIYQIVFNAWTYAKSDLWASLMQEIFYELNRQISLEQQLGRLLSDRSQSPATGKKGASAAKSNRYLDQFIYNPLSNIRRNALSLFQGFDKKSKLIAGHFLNLAWIQFILHIAIPVIIGFLKILIFILEALIEGFDKSTGMRLFLAYKLSRFLPLFWEKSRLENQIQNYYFPDNLETSYNSWKEGIESVLEHTLFLLFVGFPKRLKDRKAYWRKATDQSRSDRQNSSNSEADQAEAFAQALREGGEFWQVLYLMSEEERTAFLKANLKPEQFKDWKEGTSSSEISNVLWNALDKIKQDEQKLFRQKEQELQAKEKELQRQLKGAEVGVNQQLAQRKISAFWLPIVNAIAKLRFSGEQIEKFAAAGETMKMLRQTVTSWQGFIALFVMTLVIVFSLDSESRTAIFTSTQTLFEKTGFNQLLNSLSRLLPGEVTRAFTSLGNQILIGFKDFPQWVKVIQAKVPTGIQILTAITALGTALIPVLKALDSYLTSVKKEQARIQGERDVLLKQAQGNAENLVKEVAQLKLQVEEQRQRVGLTANYASLMDFVSDRLKGDEYGKRLGMMQQVKQDLAALSDRLTSHAHNREELQKCFPRGPARVILYIDDLDRCPPNRVVEVLEAVQLLLNTKLFVVVLGIDDRYIARALEQVYHGVLKRGGKPSGIDYLEKIIQIPYRMRPISPATVESYLRAQLQIRKSAPPAAPAVQIPDWVQQVSNQGMMQVSLELPVEAMAQSVEGMAQSENADPLVQVEETTPVEEMATLEQTEVQPDIPSVENDAPDETNEPVTPKPSPSARRLNRLERRRLERRQEDLQEEWESRSKRVAEFRKALVIETGTAAKFQLQQQVQAEEEELTRIENLLSQIEQDLTLSPPEISTPVQIPLKSLKTSDVELPELLPVASPQSAVEDSADYLETVAAITEFDETELQLLVNCCRHVDITPRTAKRLINIYKILQIIWLTRSQKTPPQPQPSPQEKRLVMSFLALSGRYSNYMRSLFEEIDLQLEENGLDELGRPIADNPQLDIPLETLLETIDPQPKPGDRHANQEWEKFNRDIERMLQDPEQGFNEPVRLEIDRRTFDLMLSFCFVGDIGYDPDDYSAPSPVALSEADLMNKKY